MRLPTPADAELRPVRVWSAIRHHVPAPVVALGEYSPAAAEVLVCWKEQGDRAAGAVVATLVNQAISAALMEFGGSAVVAVPSRWRSRVHRAADPLAVAVNSSGFPVVRALRRTSPRDQVGLSRPDRWENAAAGFAIRPRRSVYRELRTSGGVIVIDDVITTGATLVTCGHLLANSGWDVRALVAPFARSFT